MNNENISQDTIKDNLLKLESNINFIEQELTNEIRSKICLKNDGKSTKNIDNIIQGYYDNLKKYQLQLNLFSKEIPNINTKEHLLKMQKILSSKVDSLLYSVKKNKIPNLDKSNSNNLSINNSSYSSSSNKECSTSERIDIKTLNDEEISQEFSNIIKKIKTVCKDIDTKIVNEQKIIDSEIKQIDNVNNNINASVKKMYEYMEVSSNACLYFGIFIELIVFVFLIISM